MCTEEASQGNKGWDLLTGYWHDQLLWSSMLRKLAVGRTPGWRSGVGRPALVAT